MGSLNELKRLEINGGRVHGDSSNFRLELPSLPSGKERSNYCNAQLDDYSGLKRKAYKWQRGAKLALDARFSHPVDELVGTAGFGFWNAPFGDPMVPYPALPQATWFFFGSQPNDLPLSADQPGRGWFSSTLDATSWRALSMAPFAPFVVVANRLPAVRRHLWPAVQNRLGMSFCNLNRFDVTIKHRYELDWGQNGCAFRVNGQLVHQTDQTPRGPLGFVCWIDNQYMAVTSTGRMQAGTLSTSRSQFLEVENLCLK